MANYYQVQRATATLENGRYFQAGSKYIAVIPFYMPKHGGINAWEFTGTKEVTDSDTGEKSEVWEMPKGFKAYLFSCAQAFMDFMETKFSKRLQSTILTRNNRGIKESYQAPENYTGNPGDYIIIGGSSQRDAEYDADFPVPNHVTISYAHGDRPYYSEDGERFWSNEDMVHYFSVVIFDENPGLKKLVSTIYFT